MLTPINQEIAIPDLKKNDDAYDAIYALYEAGILTGATSQGDFFPSLSLTRAELATIAARLVSPALRISFSPQEPVYQNYTLTKLDLAGSFESIKSLVTAEYLPVNFYDSPEGINCTGWGIYDAEGKLLISRSGENLVDISNGLALVTSQDDASTGVLDLATDKLVLPMGQYGEHALLSNGQFITRVERDSPTEPIALWNRDGTRCGSLYGLVDEWADYEDGVAPHMNWGDMQGGYMDLQHQWVLEPKWNQVYGFQDGHAIVYQNNRFGVIDRTGAVVIPIQYEQLGYFGGGLYCGNLPEEPPLWVRLDGSTFTNPYAELYHDQIPYGHWVFQTFRNGYIPYGDSYLDAQFQPVTPKIFEWTGPVGEDGSAFVRKDGDWYRLTFQQEP